MLGYSFGKISKREKRVLGITNAPLVFPIIGILNLDGLFGPNMDIYIAILGATTISFLFPRILYFCRIDMNNTLSILLWTASTLIIGAIGILAQFGKVSILPFLMLTYLHLMRVIHYWESKQLPSYKANRFTVGEYDIFAKRKISKYDLAFSILYSSIPILVAIILVWFFEVYS